jgi:hypothetical protein
MDDEIIEICNKQYPCPCCGYMSFDEPPGSYDICPICFWEDDASQLRNPYSGGANIPLVKAQAAYINIKAKREDLISYVREPVEGDIKCEDWRPFNPETDDCGEILGGMSYFESVCAGIKGEPYYWRRVHTGE